jgi:hypothetical protein
MTSKPSSSALRLLALVLSALIRHGYQHVAELRVEGESITVNLLVNAKLRHQVDQLVSVVSEALISAGLTVARDPLRCLVLKVSASPEALLGVPSAEAVAVLLDGAVRERMAFVGCFDVERVRVKGASQKDGTGDLRFVGGDGRMDEEGTNARAVAFGKKWLEKHLPEVRVEGAMVPGVGQRVSRSSGQVVRVLRITVAAASMLAA